MGSEAVIRGGPSSRVQLICAINDEFNRLNIQSTAARLGALASTGDFLEICDALGLLAPLHRGNFAAYRTNLTIPPVIQSMLTAAFRHALTATPQPIPLQILIVSGMQDIVTITSTATEISVLLTRDDTPASGP